MIQPEQVRAHRQQGTEMLRKQFPGAVPVMEAARDDVLAFLYFPQEHLRKIWSTNPLERLNKETIRRPNVVGIFPNDAAIVRLVGSQLLEQQEEWQLERRRALILRGHDDQDPGPRGAAGAHRW
ncbi:MULTISPECIES: transposase [unclassified Synechococcus]|uniref:transposase n=1 Tax=Synechococcus sp. CCFWC 502 TaxID=2978474 RepID=UPI0002FC4754|nr:MULTISPECIES: transposase [unclassified Synechococcus]WFN60486.1 transposase [Synechococcus sp. CCFWC 502]